MFELSTVEQGTQTGDVAWWERSLGIHDARAGLYAAFADVLRFPGSVPSSSIEVIAGALESLYPEDSNAVQPHIVSAHALSWMHNIPDATSLAVEHIRIFGGFGIPGATNCIVGSPASLESRRRVVEQISDAYHTMGYWTEDAGNHPLCPAHASNAFGFMAHCLLVGDLGVVQAAEEAEWFFSQFLRDWMPGFAGSIGQEARHPVTEMTGLALSGFASVEATRGASGAGSSLRAR